MSDEHSFTELPETEVRLLDQLCDGFERAWQNALRHGGQRPQLEVLLAQLTPDARDPGLRELLKVEIAQRREHGEQPVVEDYVARFPELGPVLPALLAREEGNGRSSPVDSIPEAESIPGYRLLRRLGAGGIGEVFLASELFSTREDALRSVALKAIRSELLPSPRHREIMENDIRIAALLDHPHIVRILHVGPADGLLYYTMPYFAGGSLAERIDRKPLPSRLAAELLLPVVRAVEYLHGQPTPVIHLDLKPGNILLDGDGQPHVADFGLARLLAEGDGKRLTRRPGGTPEYMAPEQFEGWVSSACDIYGLGAILYEMLTGRPPFVGTTWGDTMRQVCHQDPVLYTERRGHPGLEAIRLKVWKKTLSIATCCSRTGRRSSTPAVRRATDGAARRLARMAQPPFGP